MASCENKNMYEKVTMTLLVVHHTQDDCLHVNASKAAPVAALNLRQLHVAHM